MSRCFCDTPQLLVTFRGNEVCSCHEEWRLECEARAMLRLGTGMVYQMRVRKIEEKRGRPAMQQLEQAMHEIKTGKRQGDLW